uniref:Uncharacterized protein n=1 Tax=Anguilla anguilla TaxID=7936 RepID=A0A0E9T3N3_ANGAN
MNCTVKERRGPVEGLKIPSDAWRVHHCPSPGLAFLRRPRNLTTTPASVHLLVGG